MTKIGDLLAIGMILLAIYTFLTAYQNPNAMLKILGLVSSSIIAIVEFFYIYHFLKGGQ